MAQQTTNGTVDPADRPVGELVQELSRQTSTLIRQEIALARAEMAEKGRSAGVGAGMLGAAGALGWFAFAVLTAAAVLALATAMEGWLAALVVAIAYGAAAGLLALRGRSRIGEATPPVPEATVESVGEDVEHARQKAKEGRR